VHFSDCDIRTGDDDFAIVNSVDITVANCSLQSRSSGIRLEASQFNTFENLTIHSNRGIAIYERGFGRTEHVSFANILIETQLFTGHWWGKGEPIYFAVGKPQAGPGSGEIGDVTFTNISGEAESSIVLYGHPNAWLRNIRLDNVHFTMRAIRPEVSELVAGNFDFRWTAPTLQEAVFKHDIPGIYGRYVEGLEIQNSSIAWCVRPECGENTLTAKNDNRDNVSTATNEDKEHGQKILTAENAENGHRGRGENNVTAKVAKDAKSDNPERKNNLTAGNAENGRRGRGENNVTAKDVKDAKNDSPERENNLTAESAEKSRRGRRENRSEISEPQPRDPQASTPGFFSSAVELEDFKDVDISGFRGSQAPGSSAAAIVLRDGSGISIRNSVADEGTNVFLEAHGVSGKRLLIGNDLLNAVNILQGETGEFSLRGNFVHGRAAVSKKQ